MNITDATYYQRGLKEIPNNNIGSQISGVPNSGYKLEDLIDYIERLFIIDLLGVKEAELLKTAINDLANADQKYKDLIEGVDYTIEGVDYRFDGLRGNNKDSLIAYYIFCKYMELDESTYSTTGVKVSSVNNATAFSPSRKYLDCWYKFLRMYQNETSSDSVNVIYRGAQVIGLDYYNYKKREGGLVSLETYLNDHKEDFPKFYIKRYETKNSLGL